MLREISFKNVFLLIGMKTGEEDEGDEVQQHHHQQQNQTMDGAMMMQPPPQLPINLGQPPNFPMPGMVDY